MSLLYDFVEKWKFGGPAHWLRRDVEALIRDSRTITTLKQKSLEHVENAYKPYIPEALWYQFQEDLRSLVI